MVLQKRLIAPKVTMQTYRPFLCLLISTLPSAAFIFFQYCRTGVQQIQFLFVLWTTTCVIRNHVKSPELCGFILVDDLAKKYSVGASAFFRKTGKWDELNHVL